MVTLDVSFDPHTTLQRKNHIRRGYENCTEFVMISGE